MIQSNGLELILSTASPRQEAARLICERLVAWVYKPWLLIEECFPDERFRWLLHEIQHLSIYVHLQATACKRGWLKNESGLCNELFSKQI